jgi:membrane protein
VAAAGSSEAAGALAVQADDSPFERVSLPRAAARAFSQFRAHDMTDHAAALTYYSMMALFPMLLVAISLLGLFGQASTVANAVDYVARHGADQTTQDTLRTTMTKLVQSSSGAVSLGLVVGVVIALNGASGGFGAAGRALNVVHATAEDRGFVRRKATDVAATLAVTVLVALVMVSLFLGGGIAKDLFGTIGLGSTAATIWSIVRWPVAIVAAMLSFALVYALAPDESPRHIRWFTPGAVAGVLIWILASIVFALYIKNFSSYGASYGAIGGVIVLLLWLWLTNCAFLFGAELNKEIERSVTAGRAGPPFPTPPPPLDQGIPAA